MEDRSLKDYAAPYARGLRSSITRPSIEANHFEIKLAVITMVNQHQFGKGPHEDPNQHLKVFYEICGTKKMNGVLAEAVKLMLFDFSLRDWVSLDFAVGGALMNKSLDEAEDIIESVAQNHHQWTIERCGGSFSGNPIKRSGKFDVEAITLMPTKLDVLTKKLKNMGTDTVNVIIEKILEEILNEQKEMKNEFKQMSQRIDNVEKHQKLQDSQIAQIVSSTTRAPSTFPRRTYMNPIEYCNRIELSSGQTLGDPQVTAQSHETQNNGELSPSLPNDEGAKEEEKSTAKVEESSSPIVQTQAGLFPQRLTNLKRDEGFGKFLEKVKNLCIEVPLINALQEMPKFAKFLKEIMSSKRRKGGYKMVALTEESSALLLDDTPPKLQDPESFFIPCKIGTTLIERDFCNLGESVSLMPYSICNKLGLKDIKLTTIILQLVDHSCRYPMGIIEDVQIKVSGSFVLTDFVVLDVEKDPKIQIILGRPFLNMDGAMIDMKHYKLDLVISEERLTFNLSKSPNHVAFLLNDCRTLEEYHTDEWMQD
ncbi:uncharacterized protein LOC121999456 [Zingiber officinale]|uniref:uncharacterized protein LOC121999456 n=1 Tax=Zingiber officinale TaxID=94328 RepID=UPI001C4ACC1C|nr:uncharacterized protein LOC121999456 [Zingiber officinale]